MNYVFLLYEDEKRLEGFAESDWSELMNAYETYTNKLTEAGALVGGEPLKPSKDAKRISKRNEKAIVEDGPFSDVKEQLGGFYRIEAANLDEAIDWAAQCPCAETGRIEIRPVWVIDG
ncbi:MAG: YciI family protein [Pseudomonadota bacterium]